MNDNTKICTSDAINLKATKISKRCGFFWSRGLDGYRKNDRKRAVVWPWLVLELSTVLALTQLGIRQSDWWRAGIRSTNLHIVVESHTITTMLSCDKQWWIGPNISPYMLFIDYGLIRAHFGATQHDTNELEGTVPRPNSVQFGYDKTRLNISRGPFCQHVLTLISP